MALQRTVGNQSAQRELATANHAPSKAGKAAPDAASRISQEDVKYEIIAHQLAYQNTIPDDAKRLLTRWGYEGEWLGCVDDQASSFFVGMLVPNEAGKKAGRLPILAFRGTKELLGDLVADTDPVAVGYEQFMANKRHVAQLIKTAGGRVDAVGHSLGGALAQHAAVNFPSEINRVVTFQAPGVTAAQAARFAKLKKRPSVTHHISKGDLVDLAGVGHLDGEVYQHSPNGKSAIGAHTAQLLSAPEFKRHHQALGLNSDQDWADMGVAKDARVTSKQPVERHTAYPHKLKGMLSETARTGIGLSLTGIRALISLSTATADLFREENADIHALAKQGEAGFSALSAEKRSFMVYRLCQGRTAGTDESAILTILRASVANGDVAQVIQLAGPTAIYYALDGANYKALRSIYNQHYYKQASMADLQGLVNHCLNGLTERWEEMLADLLVARAQDSGRAILMQAGGGNYNLGLRRILRVLDGKEKSMVAAHYRFDAEIRAAP
ncbi:MAG TPA: Mbeg1-like protein [Herpetosiphonaceae bacterium]